MMLYFLNFVEIGDTVVQIGEDLSDSGGFIDEVETIDTIRIAAYIGVRRRLEGHVAEDLGEFFTCPVFDDILSWFYK
jgi:hypothetical protein